LRSAWKLRIEMNAKKRIFGDPSIVSNYAFYGKLMAERR
jgi:hypothetical protein